MIIHRGRLQVQGRDMNPELSESWAQTHPKLASEALSSLGAMRAACTARQVAIRQLGFRQAKRFIDQAKDCGGVGPTKESFPRKSPPNHPDARVDIEVMLGQAFVP